jgi:N-acyl-D-amino-acid deacylase
MAFETGWILGCDEICEVGRPLGGIELFEWRIRNARIVDGSGNPWFRGDVAVNGDRIVAIGDLPEPSIQDLDAGDRFLAPGFVDAHTHSDFSLPTFPRGESRLSQGVTTEVGGNCGLSPFPVNPSKLDLLKQSTSFLATKLTWEWESTADYLRHLEHRPLGPNFVPLVAHGAVRLAVMGFAQRAPNLEELEEMKRLVAEAMEAGAAGLSSGLVYAPGSYASVEELIELCRVVAQYGGVYTTHMRDESGGLLQSVEESLRVGQEAGVPVHISHHKASGQAYWGKVRESLARVDEARRSGQDVTLDQYPYTGSSTTFTRFLPGWALEGGVGALLDRLQTPDVRERIVAEAEQDKTFTWDQVMVSAVRKLEHTHYEGITIEELGKQQGNTPLEAALELLLAEEGPFSIIRFGISEEDMEYVMRHPAVMIGSDGYSMSPALGSKPHPRSYGTFARILGVYVREKSLLSLEEAVRKMTSFPAARFKLWDRGLIRPGNVADLVLFDADQIQDTATFADPHQYARGVDWVMVGGKIAWRNGQDTGEVTGGVLRAAAAHKRS